MYIESAGAGQERMRCPLGGSPPASIFHLDAPATADGTNLGHLFGFPDNYEANCLRRLEVHELSRELKPLGTRVSDESFGADRRHFWVPLGDLLAPV